MICVFSCEQSPIIVSGVISMFECLKYYRNGLKKNILDTLDALLNPIMLIRNYPMAIDGCLTPIAAQQIAHKLIEVFD